MDKNEVTSTVEELIELKEELAEAEEILAQAHPGLLQRINELRKEIPSLQSTIKTGIRKLGPGNYEFSGGHVIRVNNPPTRKKVDTEGLIERAEERGEIEALLEAEVLSYSVQAHQIERLDGQMKAVYLGYIEENEGTSSVVFPAQLK